MNVEFTAVDGVVLKGQVIAAKEPKAAVLLNPGTATKTSFYVPFAEFLAEQGYSVLLWNYRGFCESRTQSLNGSDICFADIGLKDLPAAIKKTKELFPALPIYCVGHSAGGQQLGYAENCNELKGLVGVAVSTGYFRSMPLGYRLQAHLFFKAIAPISSALFGYVKAEKLNIMEDLPPKLAKEWGRWCAKKDFFFDPEFAKKKPELKTYRTFNFPVHVFTADDDEISTDFNTKSLWKHIKSKQPIEFTRYSAKDTPNKSVGHFGYFRKANQKIWQDVVAKLNQFHGA